MRALRLSSVDQQVLVQNISIKTAIVNFAQTSKAQNQTVGNLNRNFKIFTKRSPLLDDVSKNITTILNNLLKNYESSHLPTHGKGNHVVN